MKVLLFLVMAMPLMAETSVLEDLHTLKLALQLEQPWLAHSPYTGKLPTEEVDAIIERFQQTALMDEERYTYLQTIGRYQMLVVCLLFVIGILLILHGLRSLHAKNRTVIYSD